MANVAEPQSAPALPARSWVGEIEDTFRQRDPDTFFVLPRVLRRVMRSELEITNPWVRIPHRKSYVIARDRLSWLVAMDELGVPEGTELPQRALLIARPEEERLKRFTPDGLRAYYWRMQVHARIDRAMSERTAADRMTAAQLRKRIDRIGQQQFDEIRAVLKHEAMLTAPDDPRNVYAEFVAVFFELRTFAPDLLPLYFPSLGDVDELANVLQDDVNVETLLRATCPPEFLGVDPAELDRPTVTRELPPPEAPVAPSVPSSPRWFRGLQRAADRLRVKGNLVRAAMFRRRALQLASTAEKPEAEASLHEDLRIFAARLQAALELDDEEAAAWEQMFRPLVTGSEAGFWNANARLLYDLQKVCVDHERETYRVDLPRWIASLGKQPLRRALPQLRVVLIAKHLRTATRRVPTVRIDPAGRRELTHLLHRAAEQAETILRSRMEPEIAESFREVGIEARDITEQVALNKLSAELLDIVVQRGFITLGNLRDAFSRSQWKLPDLTSAREFLRGDPLLRADQCFARKLDGVYQKGPFYLRWMQRMTSLAFGTPVGRFLTRYLALPFGGAFIIIKGFKALGEEAHRFLGTPEPRFATEPLAESRIETLAVFALGLVLFALIHSPVIRRTAWNAVYWSWRVLKFVVIDLPQALHKFPPVAWLLRSLPALIFRRYLLSPLLVTLLVWKGLPLVGLYDELPWYGGVGVLVASFLLLNSRMGRDTEELLFEWLGRTWHRIRVTVIIGLFNLIVDVFRQVMDAVERVLYSVDEWLRFRRGESNVTLGVKAVLGVVWSAVNAIIRFCVTLLIEPQVNPIKHFPVVTVSHKLMWGMLPMIVTLFDAVPGFDRRTAILVATVIVNGTPGVFGFLAWELKENWRLYAANRSRRLRPVIVGGHGETLLRLLKPGFHSGTIPKLFAKRRRVARKSRNQPELSRHSAYDERLHHEAEAVRHFIERELLELLRESRHFRETTVTVSDVTLSTNRIDVTLTHDSFAAEPVRIRFAEQSGWLVAGLSEPGWTRRLPRDQQIVFATALAGLYQWGAVDLVREHLERPLGTPPHPYDISETGLVVWPTRSFEAEVLYSLTERPMSVPRPRSVARAAGLEPLPLGALVFAEHPIEWSRWREFWTEEVHAPDCPRALLIDVPVLRL